MCPSEYIPLTHFCEGIRCASSRALIMYSISDPMLKISNGIAFAKSLICESLERRIYVHFQRLLWQSTASIDCCDLMKFDYWAKRFGGWRVWKDQRQWDETTWRRVRSQRPPHRYVTVIFHFERANLQRFFTIQLRALFLWAQQVASDSISRLSMVQ